MSRFLWILGAAAVLGAVLVSPFSLVLYLMAGNVDWSTIANVGQAFSMASSILSGVALIGVVATLRYQAQQARVAQVQAVRGMHFELSKMVMEDPEKYGRFWGYSEGDANRIVRDGYLNQVLNYAKAGFDLGLHSSGTVRSIASDLFASALARRYWESRREAWREDSLLGSAGQFFRIVDEAYLASTQG